MSEQIEGRNAVLEAFRSGKCVDKLFILDGCQDGPVRTIAREARKTDTIINYVSKERLDQLSETRAHQGVIAQVAAYEYSTVEEILARAEEKGEPPFLILLDNVEDPHNLGAIIRTANLAGAHGVIIPKRRAVGLTSTVAKTSAGAINYTPVAKVTNIVRTIEELKEKKVGIIFGNFSNLSQISKHEIDLSRLKELVENGNRIAFTNTCKGASEGREVFIWSAIEVYRAGIDAEDVVKMMTIQPAEMLGVADQIGSIEVGKDADITIYSDHPVKSYAAHVQFCMINGKVVLS